jgi:hypothetical protein
MSVAVYKYSPLACCGVPMYPSCTYRRVSIVSVHCIPRIARRMVPRLASVMTDH